MNNSRNFLLDNTDELTTAFSQAIIKDDRVTINEILPILKENKTNSFMAKLFASQDIDGNNALHHAVNAMNDNLIKEILDKDRDRSIFFATNKEGLYSFALAFKNYKNNRAILPLSIINQLYFSLETPGHRTKATEMEVCLEPWYFKYPLWRHVLYMCGMRNNDDEIKNIDLNLWDFIHQVVENGLKVWGFNVTKQLIYQNSYEYSGTPGTMLKLADEKRLVGLSGRTLNQAGTNNTLAKNKKFMQMAQLGEAKYSLLFLNKGLSMAISDYLKDNNAYLPYNAMMILVGKNLFYVQAPEGLEARNYKLIERNELSDNQKDRYDSLITFMHEKIAPNKIIDANDDVLVDVIRLVPLIKTTTINQTKSNDISIASSKPRVKGMGFLAKSNTTKHKVSDDIEVPLQEMKRNKI